MNINYKYFLITTFLLTLAPNAQSADVPTTAATAAAGALVVVATGGTAVVGATLGAAASTEFGQAVIATVGGLTYRTIAGAGQNLPSARVARHAATDAIHSAWSAAAAFLGY